MGLKAVNFKKIVLEKNTGLRFSDPNPLLSICNIIEIHSSIYALFRDTEVATKITSNQVTYTFYSDT